MPEPPPVTRTARRAAAAKRRRVTIVAVVAAVLLLAAVGGILTLTGGNGSNGDTAGASPVTTPPVTGATPPSAPAAATALVATTRGADIPVFDTAGSANVVTSFSATTDYLAPRTFLVTEQQGDWLKVLLPMRPNQSQGWIRRSDVSLAQNPYKITVDLEDHELVLTKDDQEVLRTGIVAGAPRTPTPHGTYYITDPVDLRDRPGGAYGAYALGLSGYSEVLFEFNGGPGQIAIHGTNSPSLIGQDVSNGCIRVPNDAVVAIATQAPIGTPVVIG